MFHIMLLCAIGLAIMLGFGLIVTGMMLVLTREPTITFLAWIFLAFIAWWIFL